MDDAAGIPEYLRCKRSDGKQWRCNALSMPDKTVCEKHYIQAKRRAANSALRASLRKSGRKSLDSGADAGGYDDRDDDLDPSVSPMSNFGGEGGSCSPAAGTKRHRTLKGQGLHSPETLGANGASSGPMQFDDGNGGAAYNNIPLKGRSLRNSIGEYSGRSTDSSAEVEGITCHQCRKNDRMKVSWCVSCDKRGYCDICVDRWYSGFSIEEFRKVCPACRGICSCTFCRRGDALIKATIRKTPSVKRLQDLHHLLSFTLPMLKKIHSDQCDEIDLENKFTGNKVDIPRATMKPDEQICCDICRMPIVDYHRHCINCLTDMCLNCCRDLRQASGKGEFKDSQSAVLAQASSLPIKSEVSGRQDKRENCKLDIASMHPKWRAKSNGSIPCPRNRCGLILVLRRIFKINWLSKLVRNAEEMVNGCRVSDLGDPDNCNFCSMMTDSQSVGASGVKLHQCSYRADSKDNLLYCPSSEDLRHETVNHFLKHWANGEPVIVRQIFDSLLASSWDPKIIWREIQATVDQRMKEDGRIARITDCLTQAEVDVELGDFIRGYSEGRLHENGEPQLLKLNDWPSPDILEEFLVCQRPEILYKLPLIQYTHPKWGLLNLSAKLPHDILHVDGGPKLCIAYGTQEELGAGNSVENLRLSIGDVIYVLMHTSQLKPQGQSKNISKTSGPSVTYKSSSREGKLTSHPSVDERAVVCELPLSKEFSAQNEHVLHKTHNRDEIREDQAERNTVVGNATVSHSSELVSHSDKGGTGVMWDIFRRQDIPKLNEYLRDHLEELQNSYPSLNLKNQVTISVYDRACFLTEHQKMKLKEELGIEPWTFEQHIGEAVLIPAGCAFQVRNSTSSVQLAFDFLAPESLAESISLTQEIRCLPNDHDAKFQMLEVSKMPLYATSWAVREFQKIALDTKLSSEYGFEDRNLTEMVSYNLEKAIKRHRTACA